MADPRAFISFDFGHDEAQRTMFAGQGKKDSPAPFNVQDWSSKSALPQSQWERIVAAKIGACDLMVVLVGKQTYSAAGVAKEIAFARAAGVPYFGVYVDGAGGTTPLPDGLARGRTIPWTWEGVAAAVRQVLSEGKHAT